MIKKSQVAIIRNKYSEQPIIFVGKNCSLMCNIYVNAHNTLFLPHLNSDIFRD